MRVLAVGLSLALATAAVVPMAIAGKNGKWTVTDAKGHVANITIADVTQSNGEIFVIDKVLMP
jgi:uncharacterized surface protein with fasciclin (FAS1) repeats